jgi:hypothetical protein
MNVQKQENSNNEKFDSTIKPKVCNEDEWKNIKYTLGFRRRKNGIVLEIYIFFV